jgi:hypothetical protein
MALSAGLAGAATSHLAGYRSGSLLLLSIELTALAAALEGALIGYLQWRMLRRVFPTMTSGSWVAASMIAAGFGCLIVWLPTSFASTAALTGSLGDVNVSTLEIVKFSLVTGSIVGLIWGFAQYLVLRIHVHRAGLWILASVVSWAMSFAWIYWAAMTPDRSSDLLTRILLGMFSGFVLGAALGLTQGHVLAGLNSRLLTPLRKEKVPA